MKQPELHSPVKNSFVNSREKSIRELFYYGEFLALLDFDDGWNSLTYPLFLQYISEVTESISGSGLELACEEIENQVRIILSANKTSEENIEKVFEISRDLQRNYDFSPIVQHVDKNFTSPKNMLPVECKSPGKEEYSWHRDTIQREFAKLQNFLYDEESIKHKISCLKPTVRGDSHMKTILKGYTETQKLLKQRIQEFGDAIPALIAEQYFLMSQKPIGTSPLQIEKYSPLIENPEQNNQTIPPNIPSNNLEIVTLLTEIRNSLDKGISPNTHKKDSKQEAEYEKKREEKEKKIREENRQIINSQELSQTDEENIKSIIAENIAPIQETLKNNKHQDTEILTHVLKEHNNTQKSFYIKNTPCTLTLQFDSLSSLNDEPKAKYKVYISAPFVSTYNLHTKTTFEIMLEVQENTFSRDRLVEIYKHMSLHIDYLGDFQIEKERRKFIDIPLGENILVHEIKVIYGKGVDGDGNSNEIENIAWELQELRKVFEQARYIESICGNMSKETLDLVSEEFLKDTIDFFSDTREFISFLESLQRLNQDEKIHTIYGKHTRVHHGITKKEMKEDKEMNCYEKDGKIIKIGSWHSNTVIYERGDLEIYFGNQIGERKETLGSKIWQKIDKKRTDKYIHMFDRTLREFSIIKQHINKSLSPLYKIKDLRRNGRNFDKFIYFPVIDGEVSAEKFFVCFSGEIRWDAQKKSYFPHSQPIVIPAGKIEGDISEKLLQIQEHIEQAFIDYNKTLGET